MATHSQNKLQGAIMTKPYMTIEGENLVMSFPELKTKYSECKVNIGFIRTLRIPDDNKKYSLPPGIGRFPLSHVDDYPKLPASWHEHGGIFLPMYQSEALWLSFSNSGWPIALKVAAGKINAVSGEEWNPHLPYPVAGIAHDQLARPMEEQEAYMKSIEEANRYFKPEKIEPDYLTLPKQRWLDGFNVGKGVIRQFVAAPLGQGYTVEEQLTGAAEHGGIQLIAYPMKKEIWEKMEEQQYSSRILRSKSATRGFTLNSPLYASASSASLEMAQSTEMGLGAGGFMTQDIYDDPYGLDVWDRTRPIKVFVHLVNSLQYKNITGKEPPLKPLTPAQYQHYNYPWFQYYDDGAVISGSDKLAKVDSIGSLQTKKNENVLEENTSIVQPAPHVIGSKVFKNGKW